MDKVQELENLLDLIIEIKKSNLNMSQFGIEDIFSFLIEEFKRIFGEFYKSLKNDVSNISDTVKRNIEIVYNNIKDEVNNAVNVIKQGFNDGIKIIRNEINTFIDTFISVFQEGIDSVISTINGVIASISDSINNIVYAIRSLASDIGNAIKNAIKEGIETLVDNIATLINGIVTGIKEAIREVIDKISDFGSGLIQTLKDIFTDIRETIENLIMTIVFKIEYVINHFKNSVNETYERIKSFIEDIYYNVRSSIEETITNISDWIQNVIKILRDTYENIKKFLVDNGIKFILWVNENVMPIFSRAIDSSKMLFEIGSALFDAVIEGDYNKVKDIFNASVNPLVDELVSSPIGAVIYGIMLFYFNIQIRFIPAQIAVSKHAEINLGLNSAPFELLLNAYRQGEVNKEDLLENLRLQGVNKDNAEKALSGIRQIPPAGWVQEAYLRGVITEDEHDFYLKAQGFNDEDIEIFKFLYFRLPPVSDLIRMAVREAFTPEIAEKFGEYEDYPEAFDRFAKQVGLSTEWAKAYWASHWDLPSATMGFEMFHRGIIDEDTLKLLLRSLDVMPFWRDKLIQLSYNPLTRVDVRRMYQLGVLTEEEVYKSYLDIGYSPENARRLTEFTKRYSAPEDESELTEIKRLARSTYSSAYKKHVISRDEYKEFLLGLGYVDEDADLLITIDDAYINASSDLFDEDDFRKKYNDLIDKAYKNAIITQDEYRLILEDLGYTKLEIDMKIYLIDTEYNFYIKSLIAEKIGELYVGYTIDETEVYNYLNVFQFTPEEIKKYMEEWDINRSLRTRKPSLTDLVKFYRNGLMSLEELANEIRGLGYNERYVSMYINIME